MGYIQQVEIEDFPFYCSHCKALGHSNAGYLILHPNLAINPIPPTVYVEVLPELPKVVYERNFTVPEVNLHVMFLLYVRQFCLLGM
ncbi:hypothetical protein MA16_Dca008808 [Dendrobium catenatum]|uniref:Uncharacterized protein n=1 Tax=Dendrobium catenatum TaxID=906689 RepID=A0A2I0VY39_9ASPA|nr:hypothetical protein MA16_Dca008808 [Dendrobium catenatum]